MRPFKLRLNWICMAFFLTDLLSEACNSGNFSGKTGKKTIGCGELLNSYIPCCFKVFSEDLNSYLSCIFTTTEKTNPGKRESKPG